jgi:hypothetical protein
LTVDDPSRVMLSGAKAWVGEGGDTGKTGMGVDRRVITTVVTGVGGS